MSHPVLSRRHRLLPGGILFAVLCLAPASVPAQQPDPFGDCCVSRVTMTGFAAWAVTCGPCATNPGTYVISQPDPEKPAFVGPGGVVADSRYEAARAACVCPALDARRAFERRMRTFDGN